MISRAERRNKSSEFHLEYYLETGERLHLLPRDNEMHTNQQIMQAAEAE